MIDTYINDLTNGCSYLDQIISDSNTDKKRITEIIVGIEYQLNLVSSINSLQDLSLYNSSVVSAKTYLENL